MSELVLPVGPRDHIRGPQFAPVTIVEYGDYECADCGRACGVLRPLQDELDGRLQLVFRNFPLAQIHPHALMAALAAEAAGRQGAFWDMHDMLFGHQDALDDEDLVRYATALELDIEQFVADVEAAATAQRVRDDFLSGAHSGVNGTPTCFINGRRYDEAYEYPALLEAAEAAAVAVRR